MKNRLISVLLVLILLAALLPAASVNAVDYRYLKNGEYKASELKAWSPDGNEYFYLTKDTTIVLDVDGLKCRTITSASDCSLYIEGNKNYTLTVENPGGVAVKVNSLRLSACRMTVKSSSGEALSANSFVNVYDGGVLDVEGLDRGINAKGDVQITNGSLKAYAYANYNYSNAAAVYTQGSFSSGVSSSVYIHSGAHVMAICAAKNVTLLGNTDVTSTDQSSVCADGDVKLSGSVSITTATAPYAVNSKGSLTVEGNVHLKGVSGGFYCAKTFGMSKGRLIAEGGTAVYYASKNVGTYVKIDVPANGSFGVNSVLNSSGQKASYIDIRYSLLEGQVTLPGGVGEGYTIKSSLTGAVSGIGAGYLNYRWERSADRSTWTTLNNSKDNYQTTHGDAGKYIRVTVTATGYSGSLQSNECYVTNMPLLTGSVTILNNNCYVGEPIYATATFPSAAFHMQWQYAQSENGSWSNISGAASSSYTPSSNMENRYVRLKLTVDGYYGELYSAAVKIVSKQSGTVQKGDVDLNGTIDATDYILVKRDILNVKKLTGDSFKAGDMDDNGVLDTTDYIAIKRIILGIK